MSEVRIGVIGEFEPEFLPHRATNEALEHSGAELEAEASVVWLPTDALEQGVEQTLEGFDGLWCAPGSPYRSLGGALGGVRFARERDLPFIGTCGGFQHAVLEYARNVLGFEDAQHAEYDPYASDLFISALSCSPFGRKMRVEMEPGSNVRGCYGVSEVDEEYRCNFGIAPGHQSLIEGGGLRVAGADQDGEARILELPGHGFYVATLFVPQMSSSAGDPHPLVVAFLRAALYARDRREGEAEETV